MIEPLISFGAGLLSFLSPCVLPLIPGYISYVSGQPLQQVINSKKINIFPLILFCFGFSTVFIIFGASASLLGKIFLQNSEILRFLAFQHIVWIIIIPPIASFCYQLDGIFVGATQTKEMKNAMIVSVIVYVFLSIFLTQELYNYGIWFSLLLFMILRTSTLHYYFPKILKKFK